MLKHLLVPIDGSAVATAALDEAATLANLTGARLHVVHVIEQRVLMLVDPVYAEADYTFLSERLDEEGAKVIEEAKSHMASADVEVVYEVRKGIVLDELLAALKAHGCDAVVMGSHGRSGWSKLVLGSVADSFAPRAKVPVLVVPGPKESPAA